MKALKLIGIFAIMVGGIFLAIYVPDIIKHTDEDNFAEQDLIDISAKCSEIRVDWEEQKNCNYDLYREQRVDIDQSKSMGMFSAIGYNTVNNCLRESAANAALRCYKDALQEEKFSAANLTKQYNAAKKIMEAEKMNTDARFVELMGIHSLYTKVSAFVSRKHSITPDLDLTDMSWTSFARLSNNVIASARSMRTNQYFKNISHLPGFRSGLDETTLQNILTPQKKTFYKSLSSDIIRYFNAQNATQANVSQFETVYKRFVSEESTYGVDDMTDALAVMRSLMDN